MLGRSTYTGEELATARSMVDQQLTAFRAVAGAGGEDHAVAALEPVFFTSAALALDRLFVHRLRVVTGKDGTPINEVEMLSDSPLNNNGVLRPVNVLESLPEEAVLGLKIGDTIALGAEDIECLSTAFLDELESKPVSGSSAKS
jgi:hypothetical protein